MLAPDDGCVSARLSAAFPRKSFPFRRTPEIRSGGFQANPASRKTYTVVDEIACGTETSVDSMIGGDRASARFEYRGLKRFKSDQS